MTDFFNQIYSTIESQIATHGIVFFAYVLFFIIARPLLEYFNRGKDVSAQIRIMRLGIAVIFVLHVLDIIWISLVEIDDDTEAPQHFFIRLGYCIAATYACLITFNITSYFSRKKFGVSKTVDDEIVYLDTYNSRLVDIIAYALLFLIWVYTIIVIWGWDSLLQTTGFFGLTLGFLALTNAIWLPDIYYGLVILNSKLLEDGDVIKFGNQGNEHVISRVTFIYTILLEVRNNHRLLVRNSRLINDRIDNLTKRASIDGLRHSLYFKIGYPVKKLHAAAEVEGKPNEYKNYRQRVQEMFERAFEILEENDDAKINRNMPFEVALTDSSDYALTFSLSFYLEAIPNTKVTRTIRQFLVRTPSLIQDAVNEAALELDVQLATPVLIDHKAID